MTYPEFLTNASSFSLLILAQDNAKFYAEIEKEHSRSPVSPVECWGVSQEVSTPYSVQQLQPLQEE